MEPRIKIFGAKTFRKKNSRSLKFHQEKILKAREKFLQSKIIPGKILELSETIPKVKNFYEKFLQPKFSQKNKIPGVENLIGKKFFQSKILIRKKFL